jgi:hypothetical protein
MKEVVVANAFAPSKDEEVNLYPSSCAEPSLILDAASVVVDVDELVDAAAAS